MSYAEFPHTDMWHNDCGHDELINFYLEVREKYTNTLNMIQKVSDELDEYRRNMTTEINSKVDAAVKISVQNGLLEMQQQINSVRNDLDLLNRSFSLFSQSTSSEISTIKSSIDELDRKLQERIQTVQTNLNVTIAKNAEAIKEVEKTIQETDTNLRALIESSSYNILSEAQGYSLRLNAETTLKLEKQIESIQALNDARALKWLWQYGCCHGGFTAYQWYHLTNIKCSCWNKVSPTAWEWYTMGKDLFSRFRRTMKMYSPVTGKFVDVRIALLELAAKLNINNLSAEEYEKLELSADDYDAYGMYGYEYDWEGKEITHVQQTD